jgi:CheY-like chemotaxis protein
MKATLQIPNIELTAAAENRVAAVEAFRIHRADLTLMDLQMPPRAR